MNCAEHELNQRGEKISIDACLKVKRYLCTFEVVLHGVLTDNWTIKHLRLQDDNCWAKWQREAADQLDSDSEVKELIDEVVS